ncbi:MAG: transposase, partial [Gammaproteobacteria bacterium]|nr:transposase [Gammaproteobacteria bacterium]
MGKQLSFGEGFQKYAKTTKRSVFLSQMDRVVPWTELCALVEPVYPVAGNGRPPRPLEQMLRVYLLQLWFNLSDPAAEDALYDSLSMRRFVGLDLGEESAPDETTLCRFRHLLEKHHLGEAIFRCVMAHLKAHGLKVGTGTIV